MDENENVEIMINFSDSASVQTQNISRIFSNFKIVWLLNMYIKVALLLFLPFAGFPQTSEW